MWRPLEFLLQHLPFSKFLLCFLLCLIVVLHHLPQTLAGAVLCSFPKYIEAVTGEKLNIIVEGITPGSEAFATFTHQHDNFECCIGDDRYCEPLRKNHVDGKCPSFDKNFDAARSTFNINISSMADEYAGYYQTFDTNQSRITGCHVVSKKSVGMWKEAFVSLLLVAFVVVSVALLARKKMQQRESSY